MHTIIHRNFSFVFNKENPCDHQKYIINMLQILVQFLKIQKKVFGPKKKVLTFNPQQRDLKDLKTSKTKCFN